MNPQARTAATAPTAPPARVCVVTGAATGIGAACARQFWQQGWAVLLAYADETQAPEAEALLQEARASGATAWAQATDVRDDAACEALAATALRLGGRIDALINSAGTTRFIPHHDLPALSGAEFHRTYDVNVVGMYQATRACAPALKASGAGAVVNISSIGGVLGRGSSVAYATSKGAVNTMTIALARALAPEVRVNAIAPGMVVGGLPSRVLDAAAHAQVVQTQTEQAPLRRVSQPAEVAALAWFLCSAAPGITGDVIAMDNGLHLG